MNSLVRVATIGPEPVTLAAMKNWLRVPATVVADDLEITDLIQEARMHCELLANCALVRTKFVQYLDHFPGWSSRELEYSGSISAMGGTGGWDGYGIDRHHRWHGEIKVKRPPLVQVGPITFIGTDGRPYTLNPGQDFIVDVASKIGRIRPIPYTVWPLTLHVPAAIAIPFLAGYAPNTDAVPQPGGPTEPEVLTEDVSNPEWQPGATYQQYQYVIDAAGCIEVQMNAGPVVAGSGLPTWGTPGGAPVADGTASWQNVGRLQGFWAPGQLFTAPCVILDFNSNLQLLNVSSLISQNLAPYSLQAVGVSPVPWASALGALSTDNGVAGAWRCLGQYQALGDTGLASPNSPEQQAAVTVDLTLPRCVTRAIKMLVTHWYYNREPIAQGSVVKVPHGVEDLLGEVTIHDFAPTP
jgi:hypothetical protein